MQHKFGRQWKVKSRESSTKSDEVDSKNQDFWNDMQATTAKIGTLANLLRKGD